MHFLLISPPYSPFTPKEAAIPPLGLARIASIASSRGDVTVCDMGVLEASGQDSWSALHTVVVKEPDIIGIGPIVTSNKKKSLMIAKLLRSQFPSSIIILGGPDPTFTFQQILTAEDAVDIIFIGESEKSFTQFVDCLDKNEDWHTIKGIAFKNNGKIYSSQPELLCKKEFDKLPTPAWNLFPLNIYIDIAESADTQAYLPIETSRGCPRGCVFCACSNIFAKRFRNRSPASVLSEINDLHLKYDIQRFSLNDDNSSIGSNHIVNVGEALIQQRENYELTFSATVDCKLFQHPREMDILRRAGFMEVFTGCETPNADIISTTLKTSRPNLWATYIKQAVKSARNAGIASRTNWILGLPGETKNNFLQTINFIKELQPDTALLSLLQPYPGTIIEKYVQDHNNRFGMKRVSNNPSHCIASKFDPVIITNELDRETTVELAYKFIMELSPFLEANVSGSPYYLFELWRDRGDGK